MSNRQICQVAICAQNAAQLRAWYRSVFGMVKGGGLLLAAPPMPTRRIQGISPNPTEKVTWLVDRQDYFQLEFFQFYRPRSQLKPAGWAPCDIGYSVLGIVAYDFDRTWARAAALSDSPLPPPVGEPGERRGCLQDPEGNWIEILEQDPLLALEGKAAGIVRPELPSVTRFMRMSVPDLEQACLSFVDALGLSRVNDFTLHTAGHEALWDLPGARAETVLLRGRNFLVELAEYREPGPRLRPVDYQICDQGFMNIALGYHSASEFDRAFTQAVAQGMRPNGRPVDTGLFRVMYVNDPQDFSVEMLYARRRLWSLSGFAVGEPYVQVDADIDAPADQVWQRLVDHAGLGSWTCFDARVLRPGRDVPAGTGCLRELRAFGLRLTEEIVDWDEGRHYGYRLRTGVPFRWHRGDVFVHATDRGTHVRWAIRFESRIPLTGMLIAWILQRVFDRAIAELQRQLEQS
jgi:catechol 2,3-dioxygenase-like lactoylglutathione lyase family enzyme